MLSAQGRSVRKYFVICNKLLLDFCPFIYVNLAKKMQIKNDKLHDLNNRNSLMNCLLVGIK
jgi:hypothetical protein